MQALLPNIGVRGNYLNLLYHKNYSVVNISFLKKKEKKKVNAIKIRRNGFFLIIFYMEL